MATDDGPHGVSFFQEPDDFWHGTCLCGWESPPMPDAEDVADAYGDHRVAVAIAHWERTAHR